MGYAVKAESGWTEYLIADCTDIETAHSTSSIHLERFKIIRNQGRHKLRITFFSLFQRISEDAEGDLNASEDEEYVLDAEHTAEGNLYAQGLLDYVG